MVEPRLCNNESRRYGPEFLLDKDASLLDKDASLLDTDGSFRDSDVFLGESDGSLLGSDVSLLDCGSFLSLREDGDSLLEQPSSFLVSFRGASPLQAEDLGLSAGSLIGCSVIFVTSGKTCGHSGSLRIGSCSSGAATKMGSSSIGMLLTSLKLDAYKVVFCHDHEKKG